MAMAKGKHGITAIVLILSVSVARAQSVPWETFADADSQSVCDLVNAGNAELVVLSATGELVIVTGTDVVLADTQVTTDGEVLFQGDSVGFIGFATDGDGFRTLWWTSLTGRVVDVDGFTGEPTETNRVPSDFLSVPCDACPFWDDQTVCGCVDDLDCDDGNRCTDEACLGGGCVIVNNNADCDDGDECTVLDACVNGACVGVEAVCDDGDACTDDACDPALGCVFLEIDCDDNNPCTDETCLAGACVIVDNADACDDGDECTTLDRCAGGECAGVLIADCGVIVVEPPVVLPPRITFTFCGANAMLAMCLTFAGLATMGAARGRR